METIVSGIKRLNGVIVVTIPDCLLYSAWQRPGQPWDVESAGAFLGRFMLSNKQGIQAIDGWASTAQITLESESGVIVIREIREHLVAAYLFEKGTPMGWARLQILDTLPAIRKTLGKVSEDEPGEEPAADAADEPEDAAQDQGDEGDEEAAEAAAAEEEDDGDRAAAEAAPAQPEPSPAPSAPAPDPAPSPGATPAPTPPSALRPSIPTPSTPGPIVMPTRAKPTPATPEPAVPAPEPAPDSAAGGGELARGVRLMQYLDAHAPDTHAARMRVSLQTGVPLEILRTPAELSEEQLTLVEESVRRILGVEQINY